MTTHLIGDTGILTGRSLSHILRSPDTIITTVITPIALMLLFVFVLGGAIDIRALFAGQPIGGDIWIALAWLVGILIVAYAGALAIYHRRFN